MSNTQRSNVFQFRSPTNNNLFTILSNAENLATFHSTGAITLPVGNSLQRPTTPSSGMLRFNNTINVIEFWDGSGWVPAGSTSISNTYQVPFTQTNAVVNVSGSPFFGRVLNVTVQIQTPFDGSGFSMDLGTNVTFDLLLPDTLIDLQTPNLNNHAIVNQVISGEIIQATVVAGSGTLGTGVIIVEYAL